MLTAAFSTYPRAPRNRHFGTSEARLRFTPEPWQCEQQPSPVINPPLQWGQRPGFSYMALYYAQLRALPMCPLLFPGTAALFVGGYRRARFTHQIGSRDGFCLAGLLHSMPIRAMWRRQGHACSAVGSAERNSRPRRSGGTSLNAREPKGVGGRHVPLNLAMAEVSAIPLPISQKDRMGETDNESRCLEPSPVRRFRRASPIDYTVTQKSSGPRLFCSCHT